MNYQNSVPSKSTNRRKRGNKKFESILPSSLIYYKLTKPIYTIKPTLAVKPTLKVHTELPINNSINVDILEIDLTIEEAIIQRTIAIREENQARNESLIMDSVYDQEIIEID